MLRLYDFLPSGNGYKVRLLLAQLGTPFELVECDILNGATRTPAFLTKNPNGCIPTLTLESGVHLAESNAILCYLAETTPFWPSDRVARAQTLQWLFFEQHSHQPYVAVVRFWRHFDVPLTALQQAELPERERLGYLALDVMEQHLSTRHYFVAERYGIADIALYAYSHVAHEGGFDLSRYPAIKRWLERVAAQPGHILITDRPGTTVVEAA